MGVNFQGSQNPNHEGVLDISVNEVHENLNDLTIIDVRRPDEWSGEYGHIASAKLITLNTLPEHIDEIPKDKPVVFVCRSGGRSGQATSFALQNGFDQVYNMQGGMMAWTDKNLEVEERNAD